MDSLTARVIGDIALVMVVSSLLGILVRRCGQPKVIGQILAGILLGPSLLGALPGHMTAHLFPPGVLPFLTVLAQVAVVVFMFVVGYELDISSLGRKGAAVPLVAAAALLVPIGLGSGVAAAVPHAFAALGETRPGHSFVPFMGVAVAITALPVLAAIVRERGIAGTVAGVTATSAAGIMDVAAWLVLAAALVGTANPPGRPWPLTLGLLTVFVAFMVLCVRPAVRWWITRKASFARNQLVIALVLAMGSAWVTASLGLHPVFGGFLAGLTMPGADGTPDADVLRPMEEVGDLLLPLFFVVTGLSLNVGDLNGAAFALLGVVCVIAIAGKLVPAYAASRLGGLSPRDSAGVAALVNTRGLTELIVLNVGLNAHVINQRLFTVLVLMALITTLGTSPLLSLIRLPKTAPQRPATLPAAKPPASAGEKARRADREAR
jgi:Kef-type K+ transport system membrane component KefB